MEDEDEIQWWMTTNASVSQSNGSCCIHQTTVMTILIETNPTDDDQNLTALITEARREINDDGDYNSLTAQVSAIEAVVEQVKQIDAAMVREENRVERLENKLAELKRELEHYRQESRGTTSLATVAGALLPDGIKRKLRFARDLLNVILGDSAST